MNSLEVLFELARLTDFFLQTMLWFLLLYNVLHRK